MYTIIIKNSIFWLLPILVMVFLSFGTIAKANTASGWQISLGEYRGRATDCQPNQAKKDFELREYNSNTPVQNVQGLQIKIQVITLGTSIVARETPWQANVSVSSAVCYNPLTETTRMLVNADARAAYYPINGVAWYGVGDERRMSEIGGYYRSFTHLQPRTMQPTIAWLSPINQFVNTSNPSVLVDTNDISSLYGASQLSQTIIRFWRNDQQRITHRVEHGGGPGVRRFTLPALADGLYTATAIQQLNGAHRVARANTNDTLIRTLLPGSPITSPIDFYVDTTPPTARVTLTGSSTAVESRVNAVVNVRDIGSGLRSFNLILIPTRNPGNMASVTVPFTVGSGLIGGPKDAQTARLSLRVLPGTDYQYYVVATDVAGNRYQTPIQTMRTDNVYADLDASNFRIISTCLPADVGGDMSAICPLTRADVRMNNVGGREITAGTQVPYRIESQPATGGSWSMVTTGNYSGGLQPGALSNAIPLSLSNLRGGSRLRLVVNLAPQLNSAIGEQNFTNNTSAPLTVTFRQEPPRLLLEVDRTVVRINETVSIRYEIESPSPVTCELKDAGNTRTITHTTGTTRATVVSSPITNSRTITLSCTTPDGTFTNTSVNVSVVPNVQEV